MWVDVDVSLQTVRATPDADVGDKTKTPTSATSTSAVGARGLRHDSVSGSGFLDRLLSVASTASGSVGGGSYIWPLSLFAGETSENVDYSQCLNLYTELQAGDSGSGPGIPPAAAAAAAAIDSQKGQTHLQQSQLSVVGKTAMKSSVLYSTYKATPASEVLCW